MSSPPCFGITNDELYEKIKTRDSLALFDLRNKSEYETRQLQGSIFVNSYVKTEYGSSKNRRLGKGDRIDLQRWSMLTLVCKKIKQHGSQVMSSFDWWNEQLESQLVSSII